jgi:putative membrane protein
MATEPTSGEAVAGAPWQRISPAAIIDLLVTAVRQGALQALPGLAVLYAGAASSDRFELGQAIVALLAVGVGWTVLSWLRFGYRVVGERIEVRKGVLHRQTLKVDFDRIQNVSILEPFYLRPFDKAVIGIDTAGSSGKEIRLPGLPLADARALRQRLVSERRVGTPEAGIGDEESGATDPAVAGEELLRLTRKDVVIAGLTANFMLWAAIAVGTVFGVGDVSENLVAGMLDRLRIDEAADAIRNEGGNLLLAGVTTGVLLLVLALLPALSVIGAIFRYDGYRLSVDGDRFRRTSGLLSRHDDSVRQHKIQGVTWRQNAIALLFGRINLNLQQASAGSAADAQASGLGTRPAFTVPSLHPREAAALTARFLPGFDGGDATFTGVDRRRYLLVVSALPLLILIAPTLSLSIAISPAFALLWPIGAVLTLWVVDRCWRRTGWAVDGGFGLFRKGFIGQTTNVFPLFKVQRADLVQTPAQRRRGLAHLTLHFASHSITMPWMRAEDAERLRDLALYRAESSREPWF